MKSVSVVAFVFFSCLLMARSAIAWDGKKDNKPVAELELMTQKELAREAAGPCISYAIIKQMVKEKENSDPSAARKYQSLGNNQQIEAMNYVQTIGRVARKQNGGKDPEWPLNMMTAMAKGESDRCYNFSNEMP